MNTARTIDEYIDNFPEQIQKLLTALRRTIRQAAPEAKEKIAYGIPTFTFYGNLVHFGGFKNHVSFFPGGNPVAIFKKELVGYKTAKGTIQFPLDKPLPLNLITKITKFRMKENLAKIK